MNRKCECGCGKEIIPKEWHKYRPVRFFPGHNIKPFNPISLLDKTKDNRKNQTGFLAPKIVSNIRRDAIKAGHAWELEDLFVFETILKDCSYCGAPAKWPENRNGIDRVDSSIGYVQSNCVPCCILCNKAKSNKTHMEFIEWGIRFYNKCRENGLV